MFRYGKSNGIMGIVLLVLGVVPLVVAAFLVPQMADEIPSKFNAAGEVIRWGSRTDLLIIPGLCVLLSAATYFTAHRQARANADSPVVAEMVFRRMLRNGLVTAVILNVFSLYFLYSAYTGTGLPF